MASVIHRKAKVARDEFDAREMSPAKALRLALAKAAGKQFDLPLVVRMVEHVSLPLSEMEEAAGDDGLLILLDGLDGPPGAIKLDLQFVMAMIEVQLMGEVRKGEAAARTFTPTDAAIVQPLMNALLEGYAAQMNACDSVPNVDRFRFGDRVDDGRALVLALSALDYDVHRLHVDFGPGAKTGLLELILPERPPEPVAEDDRAGMSLAAKLEENAMNAPVMLDAVLAPLRLPLRDVCAWAPGMVLPLAPETVTKARVVGSKGHEIARARLGQLNGFRAVRMVLHGADDGEEAAAEAPAGGDRRMPRDVTPERMALDGARLPELPDLPGLDPDGLPGLDDGDLPLPGGELPMAGGLPSLEEEGPPFPSGDAELDTLVDEELARAAEQFAEEGDTPDMPLPGGPSLGPPMIE